MLDTVIFDMDGLLIDSEPLWQKAGMDTLQLYGATITIEQYYGTTGLRTPEWIEYWFNYFSIDNTHKEEAVSTIEHKAIEYIRQDAIAFPGTHYIINFFREHGFKIGLATSSPLRLVDVVAEKLGIAHLLDAIASAEYLPFGKPHPQVYINCAAALNASPLNCVCFEDSFNGMIAAKAARMKCVAVPVPGQFKEAKWGAADLCLDSLLNFNDELLKKL
ncbi:MAG: hexitol phosphatase HxpB [Williamsia sp.]|nr:hexitol phosphatase HxpB [Williamsia sp.]